MLNVLSISRQEIYMKRLKTQQEQWNVTRRDMPSVEV